MLLDIFIRKLLFIRRTRLKKEKRTFNFKSIKFMSIKFIF